MNKFKSTVEQTLTESGNIFYVGNIVTIKEEDWEIILIVTEATPYNKDFLGTIIVHSKHPQRVGRKEGGWSKEGFKQFHGSVTLER